MIKGADGQLFIAYVDNAGSLKVAHCSNSVCNPATKTVIETDNTTHLSITIGSDGFPFIAYYDVTTMKLKAAHCFSTQCTSALTNVPACCDYNQLAIRRNGRSIMSTNEIGNLKVNTIDTTSVTDSSNKNLRVIGGLQFVDKPTSGFNNTCNLQNRGTVAYHDTLNTLVFCSGVRWTSFFPAADCQPYEVLTWRNGGFACVVPTRICPSDMVNAGGFCIDTDRNPTATWQAQANRCQSEGKRMCSLAEWIGACNARTTIGMTTYLSSGGFEYVDEYWVMFYAPTGNYYSAYVSAGNTECGRVYYSGWACVDSNCYDSTQPGAPYYGRCCREYL
jgi:hypothetical protein